VICSHEWEGKTPNIILPGFGWKFRFAASSFWSIHIRIVFSLMTGVGRWTDKSDESSCWSSAYDNRRSRSGGHGELHVQVKQRCRPSWTQRLSYRQLWDFLFVFIFVFVLWTLHWWHLLSVIKLICSLYENRLKFDWIITVTWWLTFCCLTTHCLP